MRHLPNLISLLRILLVVPVVWLLLRDEYRAALLVFVVAGLSDGLDGLLAKRFGWRSRLGAILDPIADKLLLVSSFITLTWLGLIPLWLTALVILRDVVIVSGGLTYHVLFGPFELAPRLLSRLNTLMQIVLVVAVMFDEGVLEMPRWVIAGLFLVVLLTTLASGLDYVVTWSRRAVQAARQRRRQPGADVRERGRARRG